MQNYLLEEYYFKLKLIGIYQFIGGFIGLGLIMWTITMIWPLNLLLVFYLSVLIGFFLFSMACGIGLWKRKSRAIDASIILQFLQIFSFTILGCSFRLISGIGVLCDISFSKNISFDIQLEYPVARLNLFVDHNLFIFDINVVAIFLVIVFINIKKKIYQEKLLQKIR